MKDAIKKIVVDAAEQAFENGMLPSEQIPDSQCLFFNKG